MIRKSIVIGVSVLLAQVACAVEDGETLCYLPLDSNLGTVARPEDDVGSVITGEACLPQAAGGMRRGRRRGW